VVTPSRATAAGVPARLLVSAWREAAEAGRASCLLSVQEGVLIVSWANRALSDLLRVDPTQLVGHSLRTVIDLDPDAASLGAAFPAGASLGAGFPDRADHADRVEPAGRPPIPEPRPEPPMSWARLAQRFTQVGSGHGVGLLRLPDGRIERAQVTVVPVVTDLSVPPAAATLSPPGKLSELPPSAPPGGWLVAVEPLTDRLGEVESALSAAEHRFAALAGCAPVGIFASDAGARLGYVNDRFIGLTGMDVHALLGTGWLDAVHRDDLAAVHTAVQTVLAGTPVEVAVRLAGGDGAQRWLQLRLAPTTTAARAAGFIGTAEDVTERRSWEEHITYQAQHDALTGLVNRRRLVEVLNELMNGRRERDRGFAVMFLDLDGFKRVNDSHGHGAGDRALIEVARRIQRVARETDVLARMAGDEFVVVLRNIANAAEAEAAARRHLAALAAPVRIGRTEVTLSASVGVALPSGFDSPEALLRAADRVMYEAKAAGPGEYRLARVAPIGEES
jgi:diguanylate cyclase (GGDEF)-like protein/PAS domain S-box-containing protein